MAEHVTHEYEVRAPSVEPYMAGSLDEALAVKRWGEMKGRTVEVFCRRVVRTTGAWEKVE